MKKNAWLAQLPAVAAFQKFVMVASFLLLK